MSYDCDDAIHVIPSDPTATAVVQAMRATGKDPFLRDAPLTETGRAQAEEAQGVLRKLQEARRTTVQPAWDIMSDGIWYDNDRILNDYTLQPYRIF